MTTSRSRYRPGPCCGLASLVCARTPAARRAGGKSCAASVRECRRRRGLVANLAGGVGRLSRRTVSASGRVPAHSSAWRSIVALGWPGWALLLLTFSPRRSPRARACAQAAARHRRRARRPPRRRQRHRQHRRRGDRRDARRSATSTARRASGVCRGARRRRQRYDRQRNRQGVGTPHLVVSPRWRAVPPGTSGAMSLEGTPAGVAGRHRAGRGRRGARASCRSSALGDRRRGHRRRAGRELARRDARRSRVS